MTDRLDHGPYHRPALVAVDHGSRDPRAPETVSALLDRVRAAPRPAGAPRPHRAERPLLPGTLAGLAARRTRAAVLVPLLLGRGHPVKRDIPGPEAGRRADTGAGVKHPLRGAGLCPAGGFAARARRAAPDPHPRNHQPPTTPAGPVLSPHG